MDGKSNIKLLHFSGGQYPVLTDCLKKHDTVVHLGLYIWS